MKLNKAARKKAIAAYATEMAGTEFDLDPELESASAELLFAAEPRMARSRNRYRRKTRSLP
jgi:hypothetical protein